ncbi:MAG: 50S ribosomal protein L18 [Armatimonadetes bacterium]|nr:50S ribosomal protein L18 [Armatimonadota bacterium]NIM24268.1 50S ribosomal protein L18 [Armatimonadota bacterium]NIM68137.1 50S ribosomal protein L18 [Armatimonadota bacterium]NIM76599.1 50S ribosomal protein L18 [Armatimonadota bacterium]NIN06342.1 50S ribosomal protein L18 [Armatimonadota bacterium]
MTVITKEKARQRRHLRVRKKVIGIAGRPRLSVFRSLKHMYGQLVDDEAGRTLLSVSTNDPKLKEKSFTSKTEAAKEAGRLLAERAKEAGIEQVVFDRAGYLYHGRVKALAEGAREGGLQF